MQNKVTDGKTVVYVASTDIAPGAIVPVCGKVGVAVTAIPNGKDGVLNIERGVYTVPISATSGVTAQGTKVYLASGKSVGQAAEDFTLTSGGAQIGYVWRAAASGSTSLDVLIN